MKFQRSLTKHQNRSCETVSGLQTQHFTHKFSQLTTAIWRVYTFPKQTEASRDSRLNQSTKVLPWKSLNNNQEAAPWQHNCDGAHRQQFELFRTIKNWFFFFFLLQQKVSETEPNSATSPTRCIKKSDVSPSHQGWFHCSWSGGLLCKKDKTQLQWKLLGENEWLQTGKQKQTNGQ